MLNLPSPPLSREQTVRAATQVCCLVAEIVREQGTMRERSLAQELSDVFEPRHIERILGLLARAGVVRRSTFLRTVSWVGVDSPGSPGSPQHATRGTEVH